MSTVFKIQISYSGNWYEQNKTLKHTIYTLERGVQEEMVKIMHTTHSSWYLIQVNVANKMLLKYGSY